MKIKYNLKNIKKIDKELKEMSKKKVTIGITGDEKSEDGTLVREYAVYNEFGTAYIPARPFFRTALVFEKGNNEVKEYVNNTVSSVVNGKLTSDKALDKIGLHCKGRVIKSISSGNWAPLSPTTIQKKGHSKPLVDSGDMIKAVDYEVKNG